MSNAITHLQRPVLLNSSIACVADVRCTAPPSRFGEEERNDEAAFIFPRWGVFEWRSRGQSGLADCNTALFLARDCDYRVQHPTGGGDDCTTIRINPNILREALPQEQDMLRTAVLSPSSQREVQLILLALRKRREPLAGDELVMGLLRVLSQEFATRDTGEKSRSATIDHVKHLIASSPGADLSLAQIASLMHVSPYHLTREFRAATGSPIHQYRMRVRLSLALKRISGGWNDLSALAVDLGFNSHSHFAAAFRRRYGVPPSQLLHLSGNAMRDAATFEL